MKSIFASHPSVYTLPGTWEPQPDVMYDSTLLIIGTSVAIAMGGIIFLLSTRRKRKRI